MNLLITGGWRDAEKYIGQIEKTGHAVCFLPNEQNSLPCPYEWVEGMIGNGLFLHHDIGKFTHLRYIQLTSAGFDRVPIDEIRRRRIEIHNARGVYSIPMAEYAVSGVLQLYKQAAFFDKNQKAHRWDKHRGLLELSGKTVCIVGCGSVGTACAKRFTAFDCTVIGVDIAPRQDAQYAQMVPLERLDTVLSSADIVILTVPLTEQTHHLINKARFANMKPGAILVNIARGAVVETEALISALEDRLSGAVLDVFEEEPLADNSPLWDMEHVIITPHNSFVGDRVFDRLATVILHHLETTA